jgi:hypothetical protein
MLGASNTLLNADHYGVYFKGMPLWNGKVGMAFSFLVSGIPEYLQLSFSSQVLRRHGDVFERTARGFYHAHGRADDTMNLGGIKVIIIIIIIRIIINLVRVRRGLWTLHWHMNLNYYMKLTFIECNHCI